MFRNKRMRCTLDSLVYLALYSNFSRKCNERILMKDVGHENVIGCGHEKHFPAA